jgi:hypothetical protein
VVYELSGILSKLKMTMTDFRAMCVICSSDYEKDGTVTVYDVWKQGLTKNELVIVNDDLFEKIVEMFEMKNVGEKSEVDCAKFVIEYKECQPELCRFVLEKNGFVFA